MNLINCSKCNNYLIAEDVMNHDCRPRKIPEVLPPEPSNSPWRSITVSGLSFQISRASMSGLYSFMVCG